MEIKDYRQPMVTSIGVILGFLMGFLGQWVTEPTFKLASASDYMVFVGSLAGVVLLLVALYRMLSPALPTDVAQYYGRTLQLYMGGIVVAFSSMVVSAFI
jgi:polyferredoxin